MNVRAKGSNIDNRAGAADEGIAVTGESKVIKGDVALDFSGLGAISTGKGIKVGGGVSGQNNVGGSTGDFGSNVDVNTSIVTNDPAAALAAITSTENVAGIALDNAYKAGEKQQGFVENTVSDALATVEKIALPANERGFNTTLYVVGGLIGLWIGLPYLKKLF